MLATLKPFYTKSATCKKTYIFNKTETFDGVVFEEGESVFDVLLRVMRENKIHLEYESTPSLNSTYIEGIANIYEFDCGSMSGWIYKVNEKSQNFGCSDYILKDGDFVEWIYSCDLGSDIY